MVNAKNVKYTILHMFNILNLIYFAENQKHLKKKKKKKKIKIICRFYDKLSLYKLF